jgi:hypothetical protein
MFSKQLSSSLGYQYLLVLKGYIKWIRNQGYDMRDGKS